jgi:hypothetical protein
MKVRLVLKVKVFVDGHLKFPDDEDNRDASPRVSLLASHPLDADATPRNFY